MMKQKQLAFNMNRFWNGTNERNAHLGLSGEAEYLIERCRTIVAEMGSVKNKTVIDFGHGGGYMGLVILEGGAKKYIGYDIAERSNKRAAANLAEFENKELILLKEHRWNFAEKTPDIIVALAVIIHFPTRLYLDNFLKTCDESGAKKLVLEIRDMGRGTELQREPYSESSFALRPRTCLTCNTDEKYVSAHLTNYELMKAGERNDNGLQVLWFTRKRKERE
jgi:hypothetical protein